MALTLLDVVVCQRPAVLQLLAGENQALLVGRDACARTGRAHGEVQTATAKRYQAPAAELPQVHPDTHALRRADQTVQQVRPTNKTAALHAA